MWLKKIKEIPTRIADMQQQLTNVQQQVDTMQLLVDTIDECNQKIESLNARLSERIKNTEDTVSNYSNELHQLQASVVEMAIRDQNTNTPDMMKYSQEPWMQFVSGKLDPAKGVEINIDWNTAFINQLKASGFTGINEFQIICQYMAQVISKYQTEIQR